MGEVVGIVLGAGSSERLGRPKQTLPLRGATILGWAVRHAEESRLDRVIVVLGGAASEAAAGLDLWRASIVHNDRYEAGCARSILAGLDAAGQADAIVLVLGDVPGLTPATIDDVVAAWRHDPTWAAIASFRGQLAHPLLFSAGAFGDLRGLHGDKAVWKFVDNEPEARMQRVEVDAPPPSDVDTWDDYFARCAAWGYEPPETLLADAAKRIDER